MRLYIDNKLITTKAIEVNMDFNMPQDGIFVEIFPDSISIREIEENLKECDIQFIKNGENALTIYLSDESIKVTL